MNNFPIKICGITRLEDAQLAAGLGAYALGFIFYPKSPRYIEPEKAREILDALRKYYSVLSVGVFVNFPADEVRRYQEISGVDIIQLHGDETVQQVAELKGLRLWKAVRVKSAESFRELQDFEPHVEAFLFDAAVAGEFGGTGHRVDPEFLEQIPRRKPFIIAGGLNSENWRSVVETYRPFAVDLSSGVEISPGIKDSQKLKKLFPGKG